MSKVVKEGLPLGLYQLAESSSLALELNLGCCKTYYSVVSASHGQLFTIRAKSSRRMQLTNMSGELVIDMNIKSKMFKIPEMWVTFPGQDIPKIIVKRKDSTHSMSVLIVDKEDRELLKVRPPSSSLNTSGTFQILGADDVEMGQVTLETVKEWAIEFPPDLEIRCKAALLGAVLFYDISMRSARR